MQIKFSVSFSHCCRWHSGLFPRSHDGSERRVGLVVLLDSAPSRTAGLCAFCGPRLPGAMISMGTDCRLAVGLGAQARRSLPSPSCGCGTWARLCSVPQTHLTPPTWGPRVSSFLCLHYSLQSWLAPFHLSQLTLCPQSPFTPHLAARPPTLSPPSVCFIIGNNPISGLLPFSPPICIKK